MHRLCHSGASVIVVDSLVPEHGGDPANLDDLPADRDVDVLLADIGAAEVADAVAGADVVFNVAGQVSHLASMQDPLRDLDLNVRSHVAFLETLRRAAPTADRRADVDAAGVRTPALPAGRRGAPDRSRSTSTASTSWRASSSTCSTAAATTCAGPCSG